MNYLFVTPKYANRGQPYEFYLGIAYVSSYMKHKGFNVYCLNPCHYDDPIEKQLFEQINIKKIDVVCTGGMSIHFNQINVILDTVKKIKPEIITVVGGAIITSDPKLALENMQIDFGIIGEGEETMAELADTLLYKKDVKKVRGLAFFNKQKLIFTEQREPISNLDSLPIPDYEGFEYGSLVDLFAPTSHGISSTIIDEVRPGRIAASRSCPFSCTFCYHPLGKKYRQRSLDNVFKEIDFLVERYRITILGLQDELFSFDKERMFKFAERIKKYNIKWAAQLRVNDVDDKVLKALKDSGVYLISYGIESLSDTILKSMNKKITVSQIENALTLTRNNNIAIQGNILFGDPAETEETIKQSLDWWKSHPEYGLNLSMIITLPDAPIYKYAIAEGLIKDKLQYMKDGLKVINLTKLGDKKFIELSIIVWASNYDTKHIILAKVISSKKQHGLHNGKNFYSIKLRCPVCNVMLEYKNMQQESVDKYFLVICRNCHMRLKVENKKCYPENYSIWNFIIYSTFETARFCLTKYSIFRFLYYKFGQKCVNILRSLPRV